MSFSFLLQPLVSPPKTHPKFPTLRPRKSISPSFPKPSTTVRSHLKGHDQPISQQPRWENMLNFAASLYPLYVTVGGAVACVKPSAFSWFVERGPASYSFSLGFIMLAMGLTIELRDFFSLLMQRPLSILFGCVAQYTIMPAFGTIISRALGLPPALSVGLILLACCPGGTASNVVVVAPVLLGSYMQSTFPAAVKVITPFSPLLAVLASSLLASSVFSENVVRLKSSMVSASVGSDLGPLLGIRDIVSGQLGLLILSVILLHFAGFFVGYISAAIGGFNESQRRAISIEVGMQNSSLGVVLATSHFTSSLVALPPAFSAVIMNIMGSSLGFIWRYINPSVIQKGLKADENGQGTPP